MEKKYSDAFAAGLKFGLLIVFIYLILFLVNFGLSLTPAMTSYTEKLTQYDKDMFNWTSQPYHSAPYSYSHPAPRAPIEYYISLVIGILVYAVLAAGFLATGAYAMKKIGQAKYSLKDTAFMGALAGLGSFIDVVILVIILGVINILVNIPTLSSLTSVLPGGLSSLFAAMFVVEAVCCCLPIGMIIAIILACAGAAGYVLLTGKLESQSAAA